MCLVSTARGWWMSDKEARDISNQRERLEEEVIRVAKMRAQTADDLSPRHLLSDLSHLNPLDVLLELLERPRRTDRPSALPRPHLVDHRTASTAPLIQLRTCWLGAHAITSRRTLQGPDYIQTPNVHAERSSPTGDREGQVIEPAPRCLRTTPLPQQTDDALLQAAR